MEKPKYCTYRILVLVLVAVNFLILCTFYTQQNYVINQEILLINTSTKDFLIYNSKCRIPNFDPWNAEMKPYYRKEKYISCTSKDLLSYVTRNGTEFVLHIDEKALRSYSKRTVNCCYMNVTRGKSKEDPDNSISTGKCVLFKKQVRILEDVVKVKCLSKKEVYSNAHAAININEKVRKKLDGYDGKTKKLSVIIIGIDSISRLNFIRTLPKTHDYLVDNDWVEYKGYNKMGENTFPNLMAILTGRNVTSAYSNCKPTVLGKLDACNFIWKDYDELGYVTGYAEDEAKISTFNYMKKGFGKLPADYYFRPYIMAAHTLRTQRVDSMTYCTGPETSGERILNLAKEFSTMFKDTPTFSFFWMNSFSHNEINSPTRMDTRVLQFFEDLSDGRVLNNSMVVFMSDHGLRFGKVRQTRSGWLEERLPFLYFWLPEWFRAEHPAESNAVKLNSQRLTTPYDLYMTLQDVLVLSGTNYTVKPSEGCPRCRSLFKEVEIERSCEEAGIEPHWCTCTGYEYISPQDEVVANGADFVVDEINGIIDKCKEANRCSKFKFLEIVSSSVSTSTHENATYLLIVLRTVPEAVFEVTISVHRDANVSFKRTGGISRLDSYQSHSNCVNEASLKPLCYCP